MATLTETNPKSPNAKVAKNSIQNKIPTLIIQETTCNTCNSIYTVPLNTLMRDIPTKTLQKTLSNAITINGRSILKIHNTVPFCPHCWAAAETITLYMQKVLSQTDTKTTKTKENL